MSNRFSGKTSSIYILTENLDYKKNKKIAKVIDFLLLPPTTDLYLNNNNRNYSCSNNIRGWGVDAVGRARCTNAVHTARCTRACMQKEHVHRG